MQMKCLDVKIAVHAITILRPLTKMVVASMPQAAIAALEPQTELEQYKPTIMMTMAMASAMLMKSQVARMVWRAITKQTLQIRVLIASILRAARAAQEQRMAQA